MARNGDGMTANALLKCRITYTLWYVLLHLARNTSMTNALSAYDATPIIVPCGTSCHLKTAAATLC
jgi:hypothetical protein